MAGFFMPSVEVFMPEEIDEQKIKRVRNLRMFKGKTDEEIREFFRNRDPKPEQPEIPAELAPELNLDERYDRMYRTKLKSLQSEYGIDLNNSNDMELLKALVRLIVQTEMINTQIMKLQSAEEVDTRILKNLGDYQRTVIQSVTEIQSKLGISREQRKNKQTDDVGIFIQDLKKRAKDFYDKSTTSVNCENCGIELARYWLNFPANIEEIGIKAKCWKCGEKLIYTR